MYRWQSDVSVLTINDSLCGYVQGCVMESMSTFTCLVGIRIDPMLHNWEYKLSKHTEILVQTQHINNHILNELR